MKYLSIAVFVVALALFAAAPRPTDAAGDPVPGFTPAQMSNWAVIITSGE